MVAQEATKVLGKGVRFKSSVCAHEIATQTLVFGSEVAVCP